MTLCLAADGRIMAAGLREALRNGPQVALISENRENGRFFIVLVFFPGAIQKAHKIMLFISASHLT
jgi:hypothetical protein